MVPESLVISYDCNLGLKGYVINQSLLTSRAIHSTLHLEAGSLNLL